MVPAILPRSIIVIPAVLAIIIIAAVVVVVVFVGVVVVVVPTEGLLEAPAAGLIGFWADTTVSAPASCDVFVVVIVEFVFDIAIVVVNFDDTNTTE